jgi:branched-chain amino acid transport system substrate-binding protein
MANMKKRTYTIVLIFLLLTICHSQKQAIAKKDIENIHIALAIPMTGEGKEVGRSYLQGINLYLKAINKKGIHGKKVVLDIYDDQNNKILAKENALKMAKQNKVLAVIGHWYSSCSINAGKIYKKFQIPAISGSTNINVTLNNDWYFRAVYNDRLQGKLVAHYAIKVLKHKTISIIHEDQPYGSYLAEIFEQSSKELGAAVNAKIEISTQEQLVDKEISQAVNEIKQHNDDSIIFLATHSPEGIKLVKELKDAGIKNTIIGPDSLSSKTFLNGFSKYSKEIDAVGYYSNDIYVVSPLIFDTANENAFHFREQYKETYNEEPDWIAAFAYDSIMVIVEAIKNSSATCISGYEKEDRQKIRDYLASINVVEKAIEGVTGLNYYDKNGDSKRTVSIGRYQKRNIISALTQLQPIHDFNEISDLDAALKQKQILKINNQYMYITDVVYTCIKINEITDFNTSDLTYLLDFYVWFRYRGNFNPEDLEFLNNAEPINMGRPIKQKNKGEIKYKLFRVKGRFVADYLPYKVVFNKHNLGISFRHRTLTRNNLIFVIDILGMGLTDWENLLEKQKKNHILRGMNRWELNRFWFFQDSIKIITLGDPKYIVSQKGVIEYSRFNGGITIRKNKFTLRGIIPASYSYYVLIISFIILFIFIIFAKTRLVLSLSKTVWFIQIFFSIIMLISLEIVLIEQLSEQITQYQTSLIITLIDVMWWIIGAILLNSGIERFFCIPIEHKTGNKVPKIVYNFIAFIIYILALFGIIAFIFGYSITSLLATSGVIAMIIGLAIQINISNIFSGIAINLERPFRIGDWIKIKDFEEGIVENITWRTTRIQTRKGNILSIPNCVAAENVVQNYYYPDHSFSEKFVVYIDPVHSPRQVEKIIIDSVLSARCVLKTPEPLIFFAIEDWAAKYSVSVTMDCYENKNICISEVWKRIWTNLFFANITPAIRDRNKHKYVDIPEQKQSKQLKIIQNVDILKPLSDDNKSLLCDKMIKHHFKAGETIIQQGDYGNSLFIILEGAVSVMFQCEEKTIELNCLGTGDFFGDMSFLTGEDRLATVISINNTIVLELLREDIEPCIKEQPEILNYLSEKLEKHTNELESTLNLKKDRKYHKTHSNQLILKMKKLFGIER